jgi:hypothetical protein
MTMRKPASSWQRRSRAHQAKIAELAELRADIAKAASRLAGLKDEIDQTIHVNDEFAELAAEALRKGVDISERTHIWKR